MPYCALIFTLPKYDFTLGLYKYQRIIPFITKPTIGICKKQENIKNLNSLRRFKVIVFSKSLLFVITSSLLVLVLFTSSTAIFVNSEIWHFPHDNTVRVSNTEILDEGGLVDPNDECLIDPNVKGLVDPNNKGVIDPNDKSLIDPNDKCLIDPND